MIVGRWYVQLATIFGITFVVLFLLLLILVFDLSF